MLKYELTKKHAGIVLWGDPWTLMELRELVRRVNDESVLIANKEGSFLGLAYDLRKAYEGQRSKGRCAKGRRWTTSVLSTGLRRSGRS